MGLRFDRGNAGTAMRTGNVERGADFLKIELASVRHNCAHSVLEQGTIAAYSNQLDAAESRLFSVRCGLLLFGVSLINWLRSRRSGVRISQGAPFLFG
jgi:hypothetical protein